MNREEVNHLASLVRMALDSEEVERLQTQLSEILDQFRVLQEVDTSEVQPTSHLVSLHSVMREDESQASYPSDEILQNAPHREAGLFRVRVVLDE